MDTSAITNAGNYQQPNPLGQIQGYAQLSNTLQQNKLMQAQLPLLQQETSNLGIAGQQAQTNLNTQRMNRAAQVTYGLMNLPDNQLAGGQPVRDALAAELKAGTIDQNAYDTYTSNLPPATQADGTPTPASAFRQSLTSHLVGTLGGQQALDAITGTGTVQTGQTVQGVSYGGKASATPGAITPQGAPVQLTTSPETNAALTPTWDPTANNGRGGYVPTPRSALPGASGVVPQPGTAPPPIGGTGGYRPPGQPTAPAAGMPAAAGGGASPVLQPPIGTAESVVANQQKYNADAADVPDAQGRIRDLDKAYQALSAVNTGYGTGGLQKVRELATSWGWAPSSTASDAINYAEAKKYLLKYASSLPGVATNQGQQEAIESNASTGIPNPAAMDVTATNIARERFKIAQVMDQQQQDPSGNGYLGNAAKFATTYDRRAFSYDYDMQSNPAKLQKMVADMKTNDPAGYNKYMKSLAYAQGNGFINAPPAQPQPGAQPTAQPGVQPQASTQPTASNNPGGFAPGFAAPWSSQ